MDVLPAGGNLLIAYSSPAAVATFGMPGRWLASLFFSSSVKKASYSGASMGIAGEKRRFAYWEVSV